MLPLRLTHIPTELAEAISFHIHGGDGAHRGIKGRYRPMRGFKCPRSAARFCRAHDELRNFLHLRSRHHQHVPADRRRLLHLQRTATVLAILEAA